VIVRADLSPAQQAVQGIHAAVEAGRRDLIPAAGDHPHLVFCTVPDERGLELAARQLRVAGIGHATFHEPDLGDSLTALCTAPVGPESRRHFRRYPLFLPVPDPQPETFSCSPR
jgi:hypothetical protein